MADEITKSLKNLDKTAAKIEKTESKIEDLLSDQLKLDKKLTGLIEDQNTLNKAVLNELEALHKRADQMQLSAKNASIQQHKRFIIETVISTAALVAALIAAAAAVYPLCH